MSWLILKCNWKISEIVLWNTSERAERYTDSRVESSAAFLLLICFRPSIYPVFSNWNIHSRQQITHKNVYNPTKSYLFFLFSLLLCFSFLFVFRLLFLDGKPNFLFFRATGQLPYSCQCSSNTLYPHTKHFQINERRWSECDTTRAPSCNRCQSNFQLNFECRIEMYIKPASHWISVVI